jgi:hypothetical protein
MSKFLTDLTDSLPVKIEIGKGCFVIYFIGLSSLPYHLTYFF